MIVIVAAVLALAMTLIVRNVIEVLIVASCVGRPRCASEPRRGDICGRRTR